MQKLSKIVEQSLWQIFAKIITSFSTFIILGLVARNYGKEGTGIFTLALTYLGIFYLIADFGFNAHSLKRVQSLKFKVQSEWRQLLGTRIIWSLILVVLAVGLLPFLPFSTPDFSKSVIFGSLAIIASSVFVTSNFIFQGKLKYNLSSIASGLGTLVGLAVFVLLIFSKISVPFLLLGHLIGWIVIALMGLYLVKRFTKKITPIFNLSYIKNLFSESWPIAATLSLNVLYFRADAFLIAHFRSIADVGIYNIAYSIFQTVLVLPAFIMNSYYPLMLKSLGGIRWVAGGLLGISILATVVTLFFSPVIIKVMTGGGFDGSSNSLQILSLGFPAYFLSSLLMWIFVAKNKYKSMFLLYTLGLAFNIILNFIFIPTHSYIAASWITVISEYIILLMQIFVLRGILRQ